MNFAEFCTWRTRQLVEQSDLLDCGETNVYRALDYLLPRSAASASPVPRHRCDLARMWLRRYGFPETWSRHALVSRGVRHALSLLLGARTLRDWTWWMPRDVYPVYLDLARAAHVEPLLYSTLPVPLLPDDGARRGGEAILLPNPLKPLGRFVTDAECDRLVDWLTAASDRRVVLDCAYDMTTSLHPHTRRLWESGKAIILHTIAKSWLSPKTFGVALVPDELLAGLAADFRAEPPAQEQLNWAYECLSVHRSLPDRISADIDERRLRLLKATPADVRDSLLLSRDDFAIGCYLFPVRIEAEVLLNEHQILAVPAMAFGGPMSVSILTSLATGFGSASRVRKSAARD